MNEIVIPYTPRRFQAEIHPQIESHKKNIIVTHRQFGKTVLDVNHCVKMSLDNPKEESRYFYIAPFLKQAKMLAWDYLRKYTSVIPGVSYNESELKVIFSNRTYIRLMGADNFDAMRGTYADGVVLDEYAQIKAGFYEEIVEPMFINTNGWVLFSGTPKGQNQFYALYQTAMRRIAEGNSDWYVGVFRADQTGIISKDKLEQIKEDTPDNIFRQEYLCDFTASSSNVLLSIAQVVTAQQRDIEEINIRHAPVVIGVDVARYGDDDSSIVIRQGLKVLDVIVLHGLNNVELAGRVLEEKRKHNADAIFVDAGYGAGVIDIIRNANEKCIEIAFNSTPLKPSIYSNKRAEMWCEAAEWVISCGQLPLNPELAQDLTSPNYDWNTAGLKRLESKDSVKERLGRSPNAGDAFALTFAMPVAKKNINQSIFMAGQGERAIDKVDLGFKFGGRR